MNTGSGRRRRVGTGRFRIIGGRWRGRRLQFPDTGELRPTPDRVRETLFNWLSPVITGARCLDLYAGSGALGLEAISRGAAQCVFVERNHEALDAIREHCALLGTEAGVAVNGNALSYLARCEGDFDIVFLDPPFAENPWTDLLDRIVGGRILRPGGQVYLETDAAAGAPALPDGLRLLHSKRAGRVGYHLVSANTENT